MDEANELSRDLLRELRGIPAGQCATCWGWPETRLSAPEPVAPDRPPLYEPKIPARCPSCGYEPQTLQLRLVDDWRGGRADHTKE